MRSTPARCTVALPVAASDDANIGGGGGGSGGGGGGTAAWIVVRQSHPPSATVYSEVLVAKTASVLVHVLRSWLVAK